MSGKKVSKKRSGNGNFIDFISSYRFLYIALIVLFILVIVLSVLVVKKKNEYKSNHANMVFPVLEEGVHNGLNIDLSELKNNNNYMIKVTNYRGSNINNNDIKYSIVINNNSDAKIEVVKKGSSKNLMKDQKSSEIKDIVLHKNKKQEDIYYIRILEGSNIKKSDLINIEINS